jgi:hypothetical protein
MRKLAFLLLWFVLAGAAAPAAAQGQGSSIERFSLSFAIPPGYCALDPSNPTDASQISLQQRILGQGQQLVGAAVECAQREAWREAMRKPPYSPLDATENIVSHSLQFEGQVYDERVQLPAKMCRAVRGSSQAANESRDDFGKRLTGALASMQTGESKMIGVSDEVPGACIIVVVSRGSPVDGQPIVVLRVRGTVTIQGRVMQFYQNAYVSAGKELAALDSARDILKAQIEANLARAK